MRVGTGHVFLTRQAWYRLGDLCQLVRRSAVGRLQRCWRRRRRLRAAVTLQRGVRGWLARLHCRRLRSAVTLQSRVRGWLARLQYRRLRAATTLQRCVRGWLARERRHRAAALLQRRNLTASVASDGADSGVSCLDSPGERRRPRPSPAGALPLHVARGIASLRHVFPWPLPFHTRRTCLPFSCELPRFLVPAGLADLL